MRQLKHVNHLIKKRDQAVPPSSQFCARDAINRCQASFRSVSSWEFSIPVLAGLIPRERFHRRKKGRCFHQKHCQEISSFSPKCTPCLKTHWEKLSRLAKLIRPSTERK